MFIDIIKRINDYERFILTSHTGPDLDAIGSELALDAYLRQLGKHSLILNSDPMPSVHRFIDPERRVNVYSPNRHRGLINRAEVIFALDVSGGWKRTGRVGDALAGASAHVIRIDHHPDDEVFGELSVVDLDAAATAELIYELILEGRGQITESIARSLYVAIMTDTGSFRYPKTSPRTHRIAASLLERGIDPTWLYRQVYEQYPLPWVRLKGKVLNSMQSNRDGSIVWCSIDNETLKEYGIDARNLDGFPGFGMMVGGARVSVLCVELPKGDVKISLRSDGSVAINDLAAQWGGGGHPSAAGALLSGRLDEVTETVVAGVETLVHPQ
jgi:bifunctional oligoribonuclease and PAP phosphatase NrnA